MQQLNVTLPDELDSFVTAQVEQGHFADAGEVVLEALRTLERERREDEMKMKALREAIDEGDASGVYEGDVFADLRAKYGLPRT
jgi:putative addiction module CopG family antidote